VLPIASLILFRFLLSRWKISSTDTFMMTSLLFLGRTLPFIKSLSLVLFILAFMVGTLVFNYADIYVILWSGNLSKWNYLLIWSIIVVWRNYKSWIRVSMLWTTVLQCKLIFITMLLLLLLLWNFFCFQRLTWYGNVNWSSSSRICWSNNIISA
jgi:hypothetical protein